MKYAFTTLLLCLTTFAASAQSVNINYGHQASFDGATMKDITFDASAGTIVVKKTNSPKSWTYNQKDISTMDFSDEPANLARKYTDGKPAQVIFSCLEVNNVNPLVHLNYRLKNSDKYFFDAVILFSSNINYSKKEDVVYIHNNENVQPILLQHEKYIDPLREKGIKVFLSILGNHDGSGICNLGPERAKAFAQAIADTLDKYKLDGVFFDDEYSEYNKIGNTPGFVTNSYAAGSRLIYEVKKAIGPDRWTVVYRYGGLSSLVAVDGVEPGEFVDYALADYNIGLDLSKFIPGLPKSGQGIYSINMNNSSTVRGTYIRNNGYGALMYYNLTPSASNYATQQKPYIENGAKQLFDDEVVYGGTRYEKDWTPMTEFREPNR